jgi:predicted kinase
MPWKPKQTAILDFTTSQDGFRGSKEGMVLLYHPWKRECVCAYWKYACCNARISGYRKSTIARLLAAALHASLIDRDIIRQTAVHAFGEHPQVGLFSYELIFALAREQLSLGLSVVVDTPLTYRTTYEQCKEMARTFQIPMLVVHCQCPPEVQKRRIEDRKGNVSAFQITS